MSLFKQTSIRVYFQFAYKTKRIIIHLLNWKFHEGHIVTTSQALSSKKMSPVNLIFCICDKKAQNSCCELIVLPVSKQLTGIPAVIQLIKSLRHSSYELPIQLRRLSSSWKCCVKDNSLEKWYVNPREGWSRYLPWDILIFAIK